MSVLKLAAKKARYSLLVVLLLFTFIINSLMLILAPTRADTFTDSGGFENAAVYIMESLVFSIEDANENRIHNDNLKKLSSQGTLEAGLEQLNTRLAQAMPITFIDSDITDSTNDLDTSNGVLGCNDTLKIERKDNQWKLTDLNILAGSDCVDILSNKNITLESQDPPEAFIVFAQTDEDTIVMVDSKGGERYGSFVRNQPAGFPNSFFSSNQAGEFIEIINPSNTGGTSEVTLSEDLRDDLNGDDNNDKGYLNNSTLSVALVNSDGTPSTDTRAIPSGKTGAAGDSCESAGGSFSFFLCPMLGVASSAFAWLDDQIISSLSIENKYYDNDQIRAAWANIRNIAYILLIPVMLVMVIGTALGFSFLDAYTVKKALPRMVVAIIFMALSFDVAVLMIEIVDVVGRGVAGLITAPFGGFDNLQLTDIFEPNPVNDGLAIGGVLVGVGVAFLTGVTLWTLLITVGLATLSLLIIFVLLSVRELLIIFLMIMGPVAIVAWIFPGNDKMWKLWWGTFSKMLYLFPIIMALLAAGRSFASIVQSSGGDPVISTIVKLVAFVGPYFFIPSAFKYAGGVMADLGGMVNDRSKGLFDRGKNLRGEMKKGKRERIGSKNAFRGATDDSLRGKVNKFGASTYAAGRLARDGNVRNLKTGVARELRDLQLHKVNEMDKDEALSTWNGNDNLTGAAADVMNSDKDNLRLQISSNADFTGDVEATVEEIISKRKSGDFEGALRTALSATNAFDTDEQREVGISQVMAGNNKYGEKAMKRHLVLKAMGGGTYYKNNEDTWRAAGLAAGDDDNAQADMVVKGRNELMKAGRIMEGAGSFGTTLGHMRDATAGDKDSADLRRDFASHVVDNNPASTLTHHSIKDKFLDADLIPVIQKRLKDAVASGDEDKIAKEMAIADGMHQMLGQTKPALAEKFGNEVIDMDIEVEVPSGLVGADGKSIGSTTQTKSVRQGILGVRDTAAFNKYKKEFYSPEERQEMQQSRAAGGAAEAAERATRGPGDVGGPPMAPPPAPGLGG